MEREKEIGKMIIKRIIVGPIETNCYLVGDEATKETIIIDPGDDAGKIFSAIKENGLKPKFILLTHNHPDHTGALKKIKDNFNIECLDVGDGDKLELGNLKTLTLAKGEVGAPTLKGVGIEVLATPGHSEESVCFIIDNLIFSGDTLFKGGIGRTDLEGGDYNEIQKSLKRLMEFPDYFKVWPGHGPETTIGEERKNNPFL